MTWFNQRSNLRIDLLTTIACIRLLLDIDQHNTFVVNEGRVLSTKLIMSIVHVNSVGAYIYPHPPLSVFFPHHSHTHTLNLKDHLASNFTETSSIHQNIFLDHQSTAPKHQTNNLRYVFTIFTLSTPLSTLSTLWDASRMLP